MPDSYPRYYQKSLSFFWQAFFIPFLLNLFQKFLVQLTGGETRFPGWYMNLAAENRFEF